MASERVGQVKFAQGMTLQIGGAGSYEFTRIDVSIELPFDADDEMDRDAVFREAVDFVETRLNEQCQEALSEEEEPKKGPKRKRK